MLGMHGNYNVLTNECDVLIALGMHDRVTGNLAT
jgi:thiamine pyrophosphate-dependent acetolactate synthase large subunit-like protein